MKFQTVDHLVDSLSVGAERETHKVQVQAVAAPTLQLRSLEEFAVLHFVEPVALDVEEFDT
jgi:hypothetical protein